MPNIWTHLIFGQQALETIQRQAPLTDDNNKHIFNLGCQGPDFLFYHHFLPWHKDKKMSRLGGNMHRQHCGPALIDMIDYMVKNNYAADSPEALYVLGFLTHHVLDRNMHPYVYYKSGFRKWDHQRFEVILDTLVAKERRGIETWITPVWREIHIGDAFPEAIVAMFEQIADRRFPDEAVQIEAHEWNESYRDMINAQRLFHDPYGIKRVLTFGQIEPLVYKRRNRPLDYLNEARQPWNDPSSPEEVYTTSFEDMWATALIDATNVLSAAVAYLDEEHRTAETDDRREKLIHHVGNISYDSGKPVDSGLTPKYVNPII